MIGGVLRRVLKGLLALSAVIMLTGCWDSVDLQEVGYITAAGIDYKDGKFALYGEMIGFSAVAKTEGESSAGSSTSWIGRGEGRTLFAALRHLNRSTQYQLSLEHLKSLVIHERAMQKIDDVLDALNRQRASRYTVWMFGTSEPLERIFSPDVIFNRSPLISQLYTPNLQYRQVSAYRPINMQMFAQQINDSACTVLLPSVSSETSEWKQKSKALKLNILNGVYMFSKRTKIGFLSGEESSGIRWVQPDFKQDLLDVETDGDEATIAVDQSKGRMTASIQGDKVKFKLRVTLHVHLVELGGRMTKDAIEEAASRQVKKELEHTYRVALAKRGDVYQTRLNLYRYHTAYWKKHASSIDWLPGEGDMAIEVRTIMRSSGKYDLRH